LDSDMASTPFHALPRKPRPLPRPPHAVPVFPGMNRNAPGCTKDIEDVGARRRVMRKKRRRSIVLGFKAAVYGQAGGGAVMATKVARAVGAVMSMRKRSDRV